MGEKLTIDALAQEIRRVDGNHSLGAGALAEALMPFLQAACPGSTGAVEGWRDALTWALAEIEGRAEYAAPEQRDACLEKVRAMLSAAGEREG